MLGNYPVPLPVFRWLKAAAVAVGWFVAFLVGMALALVALVVAGVEAVGRWVLASVVGACTDEEAQPTTALLLLILALVALLAASGA